MEQETKSKLIKAFYDFYRIEPEKNHNDAERDSKLIVERLDRNNNNLLERMKIRLEKLVSVSGRAKAYASEILVLLRQAEKENEKKPTIN